MANRKSILCSGIFFIFAILLASCQEPSPTPRVETAVPKTATKTDYQTPTSTPSPSPSSTITSTPEPTPSPTATITPTDRWDDRALNETPFPLIGEEISLENVSNVGERAMWGTGKVNDLALSPDGLILAVATNIGVYLYDSLDYDLIARLPSRSPVEAIAFSVENLWIALGETDGSIEVFDYVELTPVIYLTQAYDKSAGRAEMTLAFSDEGSQLTSVIRNANKVHVHRWETTEWGITSSFSIEGGVTSYINPDVNLLGVFSQNNLRLQSLSHPDEYKILPLSDLVTENFWSSIPDYQPQPSHSRNGDFIMMNTGNTLIHWEIQEDWISYRLDDYPSQLPNPCSSAPDTCRNAQGTFSWDCQEESPISPIELIALTPDDVMMLISLNEGGSEFRRASDGMLAWEINQTFIQVTFSPGGEFFFGLRPDGIIEKRETLDGRLMSYLNFHPSQLYDLAFSPDGSVLAAGFNNSLIHMYDPFNGELLGVLTGSALSLAFSPNGELLAGGLMDGTVRIYQLEGGSFFDIAPGHLAGVTDLHFLSDGEQLLTVSEDCTISLWDIQDRYRLENITPNDQNPFQIHQVETSSEEFQRFITGFKTGVFVFDEAGQTETLKLSDSIFTDLALSPNGDFLAASGIGGSLMFDLRIKPYALTNLPSLEAYALTFTQDSSVLAIATRQNLAFWSVEDGKHLTSLSIYEGEAPGGIPTTIEMAPDGAMIALGTQDGLIHIYSLP